VAWALCAAGILAAAGLVWPEAAWSAPTGGAVAATKPENLALRARVSASSELGAGYAARFACDGVIPRPGSRKEERAVWVAKGSQHPDGVTVTLQWEHAVPVAEVVYYGRTGHGWAENWKDYELYLDDGARPVAQGEFRQGHGPQRIALARPVQAAKAMLKFLSHYGGANPGASEIEVYAAPPVARALGRFYEPKQWGMDCSPPPAIEESADLAARLRRGDLGFRRILVVKRRPNRCDHVYIYHERGFVPGGGLYCCTVGDQGGELRPLVESPDGMIQRLDLSFDGREVLFNWKKGEREPYQVYRIGADGTGLVQLTDGAAHNYDACWLPDGAIAFLSTREQRNALCFSSRSGVLHRMDRDGGNVRRISSNIVNDFTPSVMSDGRILYGRWEYVDRDPIPIQSLWAIRPDGTLLSGVYGNRVLAPGAFIEPQQVPGTPNILCTLCSHAGWNCIQGAIGLVTPERGDNAEASLRNLTPDAPYRFNQSDARGFYCAPYPIDGRYLFLSHDGTLVLRDYAGTEAMVVLAPDEEGVGFFDARPLRPRRRPPVLPPGAPDGGEPRATLIVQDVYQGLEPAVRRGEVRQICVVEEAAQITTRKLTPVCGGGKHSMKIAISDGATYAPKKVWGYARVESDGSAHFRVPADRPVYFLAIDGEGRAVQRMRSYTHLKPGEVQGCVGCHEPRSGAPITAGPRPAALGRPRPGVLVPEVRPAGPRQALRGLSRRRAGGGQAGSDRCQDPAVQRLVRVAGGSKKRSRALHQHRRRAQHASDRAPALGLAGQQTRRGHPLGASR
jgi:hypothetical protein